MGHSEDTTISAISVTIIPLVCIGTNDTMENVYYRLIDMIAIDIP
ncbi:MAG: hypothetical protein U9N46_14250 [Euryarchaeota archaeon]|nr:hypothetical protein [Euryarchaeota archaeon]